MTKYDVAAPQPVPPAVAVQANPNDYLVGSFARGVWIPLAQNFAGGIVGIGGGVAIVLWWLTEWPAEDVAIAAGIIGGLVFCAATAVRAFRDELRFLLAAHGERQDQATREALMAEVQALRVEADKLRAEVQVESHYEALMAAERLLREGYTQLLDIHRAPALQRGMTRAQWDTAVAMCKGALVLTKDGNVIPGMTFETAWARVVRYQQQGMGRYEVAADGSPVKTAPAPR